MTDWQKFLESNQERFEHELLDFVSIPSVSASSEYVEDVERAARWVSNRVEKAGDENTVIMPTGGHPVVYGDWLHAGKSKPTILIYGHFDVQPAEPFDLWDTPPFKPEIRNGKVYGRGASDDKGGMLIPIISFEAIKKTKGELPVNVKFLFEGQEEIGSPELPEFIAKYRKKFSCDMIFSADGLQWTEDEPNIVLGLKGLLGVEIKLTGPKVDQHSGLHGGAIANPLMALSQLVASMKDQDGKILIDNFYDDVVELTLEDKDEISKVPYDEAAYIAELGVPELFGEAGYSTRERLWARPTLDINGIWGGYQGLGSKTVHPSEASVKITCRLVANQKPEKIFNLITKHVEKHTPLGTTSSIQKLAGDGDPFLMPKSHNASKVAKDILAEVYQKEPYETRLGGSIPIMTIFLNEPGVHGTMFGFSLGDENLHAPNEFFRLKNFKRGQIAYCKLLETLGAD
jgi:acetylornithine deacetylase/succinyl-diaminopimelate desuccinylase-like protein